MDMRRNASPRWPFWLLIAAWICANSPQAATYALFTWMAEARSFTHQQRLTANVVALLAGESAREATNLNVAAAETPPGKSRPPVPVDAVLKKIQLAVEDGCEVLPPALRANRPMEWERACPDAFRAPPPHGPPRASVA